MKKTYKLFKEEKTVGAVRCVIDNRNYKYFAELQPFDSKHYTGLDSEGPIKKFGIKVYTIEAKSESQLYEFLEKEILNILGDNINMVED